MSAMVTKQNKRTGPVLYCGDPHGNFRRIIEAASHLQASAIVLLGDMEPERPLHEELQPVLKRVWWIPGNHDADSDELYERVWGSALAERNLNGRVVTLPDGTRLAGLGGVFREAVWHPNVPVEPAFRSRTDHGRATSPQDRWQGGHHRKHWGTIYPDELDQLADMRADVLVTHEAPGYHPHGFEILDTLAQSLGVRVAVHGHQHDRLDSSGRWANQGFRSFGVGLRGITAIDADGVVTVVRPGELDDARETRKVTP